MRPLQLTLNFFGPYRHQTIDFTKFDQQSMFLISGPTGAGKSTIFDGLVYALYGSGSGPQRQWQDFRSEFATPSDETSVKIIFIQQGQRYELVRKPAQTLAKKRGQGTTEAPSQAELTIYQDETNQTEVKQLTRINQVNQYLAELLQMNADQFRQIVLLPQGEFRQFLDGDSDQKEAVLRNLFQTQRYERWVDQIQQLYKTASAKNKSHQDQLQFLLAQIQWLPEFQPASGTPLVQQQALLAQQASHLQQAQAAAQQQYQQQELRVNQQQALVNQQEQLLADFQQRQQVSVAQQQLQARAPEIQALTQQRAQQTWLQQQLPTFQQYQQLLQQQQQWQQREQANQVQQKQTQTELSASQQQVANLLAQKDQMAQQQAQLARWQGMQPLYETVAQLALAQKQQQAAVAQGQAVLAQQVAQVTTNQQQLAEFKQQTEKLPALLGQQATLQQQAQTLQNWQQQLAKISQTATQLANQRQQVVNLQQQQAQQTKVEQQANRRYQQLKNDFALNQIALLSQDLLPGTPCPVCGATEHPRPAVATVAQPVQQADVEQADQLRQQATTKLAKITADITALQQQINQSASEQQTATQAILTQWQQTEWLANSDNLMATSAVAPLRDFLTAQQATNQTQQQTVAAEKERVQKVASQLQQLTAQQDALVEQQQATSQQQQQLTSQLLVTQTQLHDQQQQLPTEFPTLQDLVKHIHQSQQEIQHYQATVEAQQQQLQTAQRTLATQQAYQRHYQEQLQQATAQLQQVQAELATAWQGKWPAATFTEQVGYFQALLVQQVDLAALDQQLSEYEHQKIRLETLLAELTTKLADVTVKPDLTAVKAELQSRKDQANDLQRQITTLENQQTQLQKIATQLVAISDQVTDLTALQELSEVTRGLGSQKLGLERYVLQMYLNEVLKVANVRLSQLTAGRYMLALADELGTNRKNSGLELNVYDDYTGDYRSVRTLSGGESFIAALALALALGEVVQQQTGAIEIDALFVDEGFGSLDEASLQTAINALTSLEGQQRLIGIISHVRELQVQLPNQLQVIPDGNGESHVTYQIAE